MKMNSMEELYVMELQDLHSAEKQLTTALPKVMEKVADKELKAAVEEHLKVTEKQLKRLEKIFSELGKEPGGHECVAMRGLIKEGENVMKEIESPEVGDAAIISAAQRIEHYEIAGYGAAAAFAEALGYTDQEKLLQESLAEEKEADQKLNKLALTSINKKALKASSDSKAYLK